jgi:putative ABC transport system permease protein
MFKSLFSIAFRSLRKRKFYSVLNVLGLASSMAFAFLLWLYIQDQRSYDRQFANADRIYRVNADFNMNGKRDVYSNAPRPIGPTLKSEFPEVEEYARLRGAGGLQVHTAVLEVNEKRVRTRKIYIADSTVFRIMDREFVEGDPNKALTEPNTIVLTESLSTKLFGTPNGFGKTLLIIESGKNLKVTGIIKDDYRESHLPAEAYISWVTYPYDREMIQWYGAHVYTYILLNPNNNIQALHNKIPAFYTKYMKPTFDEANGTASLIFQPLTDIHLDNEYVWEPNAHGSRTNVMALNLVVIFLIAFACINYINLETARASERAAEIGIRKSLGSSMLALVAQFLTESVLLALVSGIVAFFLCVTAIPYFNLMVDMNLQTATLLSARNLLSILSLAVGIGILAGLYPAFYLSSLESLKALKGKFTNSGSGEFLRKLLVTSQYLIAAVLIAGILSVAEQTKYIMNKDLGFDKDNLVTLTIPQDTVVSQHIDPYIEEIKKQPHIIAVGSSGYSLDAEANQFTASLENEDGTTFQMGADLIDASADFFPTIGAKLTAGRNFKKGSRADAEHAIIINETAVKKFGWEKNPLAGKYVFPGQDGTMNKMNVIGVVKDFSLGVSYKAVNPLIIFFNNDEVEGSLLVRINPTAPLDGISELKTTWSKMYPGYELEYNFVNEALDVLYKKEEKFLNLLTALSFTIIFIASLGIIGLISFTLELKKKEIAVRKVLGAPSVGLIMLLTRKFATLLVLANAIALPITLYLIGLWLDGFAYHITLGAGPFLIALLICALFTGLSLSYHIVQALTANPVEALNYE